MKWVTKHNMWAWIFLGLMIVFFGICMGIWKDKQEKPTIEKMSNKDVFLEMVQFLEENYASEQKIKNISQINELQQNDFADFRIILKNPSNLNVDGVVDKLKRKVAQLYYIPDNSLDYSPKLQKIKDLSFSPVTSKDITDILNKTDGGGGGRGPADKIDAIYSILKKDL